MELLRFTILLTESALLFFLFDAYFKKKVSAWPLGVPILISAVGNALCIKMIKIYTPPATLLSFFLDFILIVVTFTGSWAKKVLFLFLFYAFLVIADPIFLILFHKLFGWEYDDLSLSGPLVAAAVLSRLLIILLVTLAIALARNRSALPNQYWKYYLPLPLLTMIPVYYLYPAPDWEIMAGIFFAYLLGVNLLTLLLLRGQMRSLTLESEVKHMEQAAVSQRQHFKSLQYMMSQYAKSLHDRTGQNNRIKIYLEEGDVSSALDYIYQIDRTQIESEIYFGNIDIDATISSQKPLLNEESITLVILENYIPNDLPIRSLDLNALIGNALENAREACLEVAKAERVIELGFQYDQMGLLMVVRNPTGLQPGEPVKSKKKEPGHGVGLVIIQDVVDRYNGIMKIEVRQIQEGDKSPGQGPNQFVLTVLLKNQRSSN